MTEYVDYVADAPGVFGQGSADSGRRARDEQGLVEQGTYPLHVRALGDHLGRKGCHGLHSSYTRGNGLAEGSKAHFQSARLLGVYVRLEAVAGEEEDSHITPHMNGLRMSDCLPPEDERRGPSDPTRARA